jgi:hypothetical protein
MKKDYLEEYKSAIRVKYEEEKSGINKGFLINPSPARLRDLCIIIFKDNRSSDDLASFSCFFGFNFNHDNLKELKKQTDRFKPLGTFLKGETELSDINGIDLVAILVNFQLRPINKFHKTINAESQSKENIEVVNGEKTITQQVIKSKPIDEEIVNSVYEIGNKNSFIGKTDKKIWSRKGVKYGIISAIVLGVIFFVFGFFINEEECMIWTKDHYEEVACNQISEKQGFFQQIIIKKEESLIANFRKISVCDTTTFFKNGEPCVWYGKSFQGNLDCFTAPGLHPETGKTLKPITNHIIEKYVLNKKIDK